MRKIKEEWKARVLEILHTMAEETETGIDPKDFSDKLILGVPPRLDMGDLTFPMFSFAGALKTAPSVLAERVVCALADEAHCSAAGAYVNIRLDRQPVATEVLRSASGEIWGHGTELAGRRVMIEFSSPNTNKPLHLGHLRNDIIGESCARILKARGAEVMKINLINDRGIHICKSMAAYTQFTPGETPENHGVKSDRFVGDLYVRFTEWAAKDDTVEVRVQNMLRDWELGDAKVRKLWKTMNDWALSGIEATYARTGVSFDKVYRESETYLLGRDEVNRGLAAGVFYKADDGSIRLDMSDIGLDTKILLRSDGTAVYITQDLGTAISRHRDWPFDELIYVVAREQEYHFKVLFHALKKLGYDWADRLRHLAYGMVNLPEGRMKSREGTVVDADDLLDELEVMAKKAITERDNRVEDVGGTAEKIALAALHYYLLQISPVKDMMFNPKESLSFTGNTGPYLQYVTARIAGLSMKASAEAQGTHSDAALLTLDEEWRLIRAIAGFPEAVSRAAVELDPSIVTAALYEIARDFSRYYHDIPIAKAPDAALASSRLALSRCVLATLKSGLDMLNIPYLTAM